MKARTIRIDIACNDPDNGIFASRANGIQIADADGDLIELEPYDWERGPRFIVTNNTFRLSGKNWPYLQSKEWYGNWCWNAYWLNTDTAIRFLHWLHSRELFQCTHGRTDFHTLWDWKHPLPIEKVKTILTTKTAGAAA